MSRSGAVEAPGVTLKGPAAVAARANARRRGVFLSLLANVPEEFGKQDITGQAGAKAISTFVMNRAFSDLVADGTIRRLSKGRYKKGAVSAEPIGAPPEASTAPTNVEARVKYAIKALRDARASIRARLVDGRLDDEDRAHHLSALALAELAAHGAARVGDAVQYLKLARRAIAEDMKERRLQDEDAAHTLGKVALMRLQGEI